MNTNHGKKRDPSLDDGSVRSIVWPRLRNFIGGSLSGMANTLAGHPFDTLKVRMQTEGTKGRFKGPIDCLKQTVRQEGFRGLYKGVTPPLFGMGIINSCMFGSLHFVKDVIHKDPHTPLTLPEIMVSGAITGWIVSLVVTPIDQVKARLQVQYALPPGVKPQYSGPIDCIQQLIRNNGVIGGMYKGWFATVLQRTSLWAYFGGYELARRVLPKREDGTLGVGASFLAGGAAGTGFWLTNYPFDVIKNRLMSQPDVKPRKYDGVIDCAKKIYKVDGIKGFFRGFTPTALRTFPANGATMITFNLAMRFLPE
eukprot:TRINITY_DN944_c0_g2_i1.p1 TRINITY_DN944_c0_g2~~TRINITY_DN944_c0_g2_i1.p1  ORF type:complete len:310 (-),score=44.46 TRINITY_DN944_c0_g2_i1:78-1007(-)